MSISTYNIERGGEKSMVVPMRKISSALPDITVSAITTATSVMTLFLAQLKKTNKKHTTTKKHNSIKYIWAHCDFWRNLLLNIKSLKILKSCKRLIYIAFPFQTPKDKQIWLCCQHGRWVSLSSLFLVTYQVSDRR